MNHESLLDKLLQKFTSKTFENEVMEAKKEFHRRAGLFDEGSNDFELKMAQFSDWYLFVRPLIKEQKPPVELAAEDLMQSGSDDDRKTVKAFLNSVHSLFLFHRLKDSDLYVEDLFSGDMIVVKNSTMTVGFNNREIFEGRLIPTDDSYLFTRSFCFHPEPASRFIRKEIEKVKTDSDLGLDGKENLILKLFRMRHKHEQYKHVDVSEIYSNSPKLRI